MCPPQDSPYHHLKAELTRGSAAPHARVVPLEGAKNHSSPVSGVVERFNNANLSDFVQFECMRGLTRAVLVSSQTDEGVLYFDEGQLVHAETSALEGEAAALCILCWGTARVEPSPNIWVLPNTIETSWQGLLMKAAHQLDESKAGNNLAVQPTESPVEKVFSNLEDFVEFKDPNLLRAVRLDSEGDVITSRGEMADFPDAACYAVRLAELIGEGLGLENFSGLECVTTKKLMLVYVDEDTLVAVEADPSVDLSKHRKRAGT